MKQKNLAPYMPVLGPAPPGTRQIVDSAHPEVVEAKQKEFLDHLRRNGGQSALAAEACGLSLAVFSHLAASNPQFAQSWVETLQVCHEELLTRAHAIAGAGDVKESAEMLRFLIQNEQSVKKYQKKMVAVGSACLQAVRLACEEMSLSEQQILHIQRRVIDAFKNIEI
jgi:hypothetical protein